MARGEEQDGLGRGRAGSTSLVVGRGRVPCRTRGASGRGLTRGVGEVGGEMEGGVEWSGVE
jgi:hypothetical protein